MLRPTITSKFTDLATCPVGLHDVARAIQLDGSERRTVRANGQARGRNCSRVMRGYSLVEIMVVVAIIGVVSAVATPNISKAVRRANEPAQLLRVHGFLVEARNFARRTNQCVTVTRSASGTTLTAQPVSLCAATETCSCRSSVVAPETFTLDLMTQSPAVTVTAFANNTGVVPALTSSATGELLLFLPNGATPYPSTATVHVSMPERGQKTITILPASGIIRVEP